MSGSDPQIQAESLLRHGEFLRRLARALLADEHGAEDVVQEAYAIALERPPRSEEALGSWLARVVRNLSRNRLRGENRRATREQLGARKEEVPSAEDVAARLGLQRHVVAAVTHLREPYRRAIYLRWYEDLPPREIARRLGIPVQTVHSQLKRGLAMLRCELDGELGDRRTWCLALVAFLGRHPARVVGAPAGLTAAWMVPSLLVLVLGTSAGLLALDARQQERPVGGPDTLVAVEAGGRGAPRAVPAGDRVAAVPSTPGVAVSASRLLSGRVVRAGDGAPLEDVTVVIGEGGEAEEVGTAADGRFLGAELHRADAPLRFLDGPERGELELAAARDGVFALEAGPGYRFELRLPAGVAPEEIVARLVVPEGRGWTSPPRALRDGPWPWVRFPRAPRVSLLEAGVRSAFVLRLATRDGLWAASTRVHAAEVDRAEPLRLELTARGALSVRVVDASGGPVGAATLRWSVEGLEQQATCDEGGAFELTALPPGPLRLRACATDCATSELDLEVTAARTSALEIVLERLPTATLEGRLTSRTGRHVPRGRVRLTSVDDPERVLWASCESAGGPDGAHAFHLEDVPLGEYELLPPMEDGFAWSPPSLRVRLPGPAPELACLDDVATRELVFRPRAGAGGAPIERFRVAVLVDRYRWGIPAAAAFDPGVAPREARFDEGVMRVPADLPLAWLVESEGRGSVLGGRRDLHLDAGGRLVADVALEPSWRARVWVGTRDEEGREVPLAGARLLTTGGTLLAESLDDGEAWIELAYDPGRLTVALPGWRPVQRAIPRLTRDAADASAQRVWLDRP